MPNASLPCSVGPSNQPLGPEAANDDAGRHGEEIPRPDDSSRQTDPKHSLTNSTASPRPSPDRSERVMSHRSSVPPTPAARTTRAAILVVALACLLAVIPGVQTRATAADLIGHDISWANCPIDEGGYGLPTPPSSSKFVIIGLTKGLAFGENPCLGSQVTWATDNSKPAQAYTVATYRRRPSSARTGRPGRSAAPRRSVSSPTSGTPRASSR